MSHPLPVDNVIVGLESLLDELIEEETETEKGDIRVVYLQRAIEILREVEKLKL